MSVGVLLGVLVAALPASAEAGARNVVIMIGDGMCFEQVKAAGMYADGAAGTLSFEALPYRAEAETRSADSSVTDSAAAATAIATGAKVNNGVISMAYPGDGSELETLMEYCQARNMSVGLVTTTYMTHATPAAFGAHEPDRNNNAQIAADYLGQTRPNVLFGGGANGLSVLDAENAGYVTVTDRSGVQAVDTATVTMVSGQFGTSHLPYEFDGAGALPHLSEMTATALEILTRDPDGFFLMVEGGRIDHACHDNDIDRAVMEVVEFDAAFDVVMAWADGRTDTLIVVTADHETGGLTVLTNNGAGNMPTVSWSTTGHTGANVPVYAWGAGAETVTGVLDNTDLFAVAVEAVSGEKPSTRDPAGCSAAGGGQAVPTPLLLVLVLGLFSTATVFRRGRRAGPARTCGSP